MFVEVVIKILEELFLGVEIKKIIFVFLGCVIISLVGSVEFVLRIIGFYFVRF